MSGHFDLRTTAGAVAIGRNEGERLRACLRSLTKELDHVVYVDSGSVDDSLAIAEQLGVDVVGLDLSNGFTAARARNAGFRRLQALAPEIEFVQFVDGDCEVVEGWLQTASDTLEAEPQVAVVCGCRLEREPARNIYHRLANMEWHTLPGRTHSCGGDAMIRCKPLEQVGGYCDSLIAGEEPELCTRLRKAGWGVLRLDKEMTLHDIRMTHFSQWWKRAVRAGHAYAEVAALHGSFAERKRWRKLISIWFWVLFPVLAVGMASLTGGTSLLIAAVIYVVMLIKVTVYRMRKHGDELGNATLYAVSCIAANWPQAAGSLQYFVNRMRGSRSELIEYNRSSSLTSNGSNGETLK